MRGRGLHLLALFATIAVLWLFMFWLQDFDFGSTLDSYHPKTLVATGFIVLAAFSMGEFFKLLQMPALLGYIAAGVLFGPNLPPMLPNAPEALFSQQVISDLSLVNVLTVGVIGTMGGGELKLADIKHNAKTILWTVGLIFVIVVPATFSAVLILVDHFPAVVPFLEGRSQEHVYAAALMLAVFGLAMSPAATLAILQETRAKGRFTSLVLGLVIVMDLVLVASFLLILKFDMILIAPGGFEADALIAALPTIGAEFGYAILIGIGTGLVFILFLRFIRRERLFFTVAIIFVTTWIADVLHAETLAAFLTAGFIVQNFSKHGHEMIHALEKISLPVFVIYFMTQAAQLDLAVLGDYVWLTVVLTVIRAAALYLGSRIGSELAGADQISRRYLWLGLFSRGGVDLVLAAIVGGSALAWGTEIQTVVMGVVVVHIIGGPPLLKLALDRSGETEGSRRQTREEAEAFDQLPAVGEPGAIGASFPVPRFEDDQLNARVTELREVLVEVHNDYIAQPLDEKVEAMRDSLAEASDELGDALEKLEAVLTSDEPMTAAERSEAVAQAHIEYLHDIADNVETWEEINPEIVHHERVFELISHLRNQEEFGTVYRVRQEDFLFEPAEDDRLWIRSVKAVRRVRRSAMGRGTRSVPLGRLWRYFVELTVPRYLARAADATAILNERFWSDLGNHMRRVDDLFDEIFDTLHAAEESPVRTDDADISGEVLSPSSDAVDHVARARDILSEGREQVAERERALLEQLNQCTAMALDRYTVSVRETYARFLDAVMKSGTIELPQFRYRPSLLFDRSRRAEAHIESRLRREHTVVTGQRGWIVAEWQLVLFLYWLETYEERARDTLTSMVANPISGQLDVLRAACMKLPEAYEEAGWEGIPELRSAAEKAEKAEVHEEGRWPPVDWEDWLEDEISPILERARTNLQRMLALYAQGHAARRLLEMLERRVAQFSDELILLSEHPDQIGADEVVPTLDIPLREWFVSELVRETALRLVEFNERGEAIVRDCISVLEDVQQVVEFNLRTAQRDAAASRVHAVELAAGGLERAARMLEELRASYMRSFGELTRWIILQTNEIAERASEPFLEHRAAEIERLMARRGQATLAERGESFLTSAAARVTGALRSVYRRYQPVARDVIDELRGLLVEDVEPIRNADIRMRLHPDERVGPRIPAIYRRLFTPVPLDIPDFYVPRREVERRLIHAIEEWADGKPNAILLYGDRGMGKRSTLHHVLHHSTLPAWIKEIPTHTVMLDDDLQTEAELVQKVGTALPNEPAETMEGLARFIDVLESRHIVVLERGEKLFSRTDAGLDVCRRFLAQMNDTSDNVLWIVLMGRPAVTFLDTAIGVLDYFTHAIELDPIPDDAVEELIQKRHRVSGFRANFRRERARVRDWVRRPLATSEAMRDPRAEYFRDLARLSRGNPMLALLYWLDSASLDDADDHLIWVDTLPDSEPAYVASLNLSKRLILAALVQHHSLTPMQLRSILRREFEEVQTELEHLRRLGFVTQVASGQVMVYRLRANAVGVVTSTLRDMNMI